MYTFIHHEGSTVYIQSKLKENYYYRQTRRTHIKKDNSPTISLAVT